MHALIESGDTMQLKPEEISKLIKQQIKNYENKLVCLRRGPGTKYKTIATYQTGTKITVLQSGKTWSKVSIDGKTGYIKSIFIRKK